MSVEGLVTRPSRLDPKTAMDRLEAAVKARGLSVFARIDHAAGAAALGLPLRPTELLVFGHAKGGTPLMQAAQTAGLDLPLRALVWQDEAGLTRLGYNDPLWLARRHGIGAAAGPALEAMAALLRALIDEVGEADPGPSGSGG